MAKNLTSTCIVQACTESFLIRSVVRLANFMQNAVLCRVSKCIILIIYRITLYIHLQTTASSVVRGRIILNKHFMNQCKLWYMDLKVLKYWVLFLSMYLLAFLLSSSWTLWQILEQTFRMKLFRLPADFWSSSDSNSSHVSENLSRTILLWSVTLVRNSIFKQLMEMHRESIVDSRVDRRLELSCYESAVYVPLLIFP